MVQKVFKKLLFAITIAALVISSGACSKTTAPVQDKKITIGLMSDTAAIPFILAQELNYFKDEGLEVEIQIFQSAVDRDSALQADELDGVSSDLISAGFFKESGNTLLITSRTECEYKLIASSASGISDISQLSGKKIGTSTNTLMEYLVDTFAESKKLKDIEKINIPKMPARLEMLKSGQIDAATLPEPLATLAVMDGSKEIGSNVDLGIYPGVILFKSDFLNSNPDSMAKFYRAYDKTVKYINENGLESHFALINEKLSFPESVIKKFSDIKYGAAVLPSEENVASAMDWLYKKEFIKEKFTYDQMTYSISTNK
ncbi:MAG: ABC transporter substrate-binding protein [Eubacteriaceae bacterium]|nr:ABC transporter substrate-binding protein [Eubacteriaceae bacterium]